MDVAKWGFSNCKTANQAVSQSMGQKAAVVLEDQRSTDDHFEKNAIDTNRDGVRLRAKLVEADAPYLGDGYYAREDHKSNYDYSAQAIVKAPDGKEIATSFTRNSNSIEGFELTKGKDGNVHGFRFHGEGDNKLVKSYLKTADAKVTFADMQSYLDAGRGGEPWHDMDRPGSGGLQPDWLSPY